MFYVQNFTYLFICFDDTKITVYPKFYMDKISEKRWNNKIKVPMYNK